jgi:hypothetical protein
VVYFSKTAMARSARIAGLGRDAESGLRRGVIQGAPGPPADASACSCPPDASGRSICLTTRSPKSEVERSLFDGPKP